MRFTNRLCHCRNGGAGRDVRSGLRRPSSTRRLCEFDLRYWRIDGLLHGALGNAVLGDILDHLVCSASASSTGAIHVHSSVASVHTGAERTPATAAVPAWINDERGQTERVCEEIRERERARHAPTPTLQLFFFSLSGTHARTHLPTHALEQVARSTIGLRPGAQDREKKRRGPRPVRATGATPPRAASTQESKQTVRESRTKTWKAKASRRTPCRGKAGGQGSTQ